MTYRMCTLLLLAGAVAACSTPENLSVERPEAYVSEKRDRDYIKYGSLGGNDNGGFLLYGPGDDDETTTAALGVGTPVNGFLWRASLETIDFMPLVQTDPVGGVILTDWYSPPSTSSERFKLNVFVLGTELRADGVRVSAFRQVRGRTGEWVDAEIKDGTASGIADSILSRARQLRVASLEPTDNG